MPQPLLQEPPLLQEVTKQKNTHTPNTQQERPGSLAPSERCASASSVQVPMSRKLVNLGGGSWRDPLWAAGRNQGKRWM